MAPQRYMLRQGGIEKSDSFSASELRACRMNTDQLGDAEPAKGATHVEHLDDDEDGERNGGGTLGHLVGEHVAADLREQLRARVEVSLRGAKVSVGGQSKEARQLTSS